MYPPLVPIENQCPSLEAIALRKLSYTYLLSLKNGENQHYRTMFSKHINNPWIWETIPEEWLSSAMFPGLSLMDRFLKMFNDYEEIIPRCIMKDVASRKIMLIDAIWVIKICEYASPMRVAALNVLELNTISNKKLLSQREKEAFSYRYGSTILKEMPLFLLLSNKVNPNELDYLLKNFVDLEYVAKYILKALYLPSFNSKIIPLLKKEILHCIFSSREKGIELLSYLDFSKENTTEELNALSITQLEILLSTPELVYFLDLSLISKFDIKTLEAYCTPKSIQHLDLQIKQIVDKFPLMLVQEKKYFKTIYKETPIRTPSVFDSYTDLDL